MSTFARHRVFNHPIRVPVLYVSFGYLLDLIRPALFLFPFAVMLAITVR
jgi:hypothetical protein